METYGKILLIAMPIFLGLVLLEKLYGWAVKKHPFRTMDIISSMSSGYTNIIKDVLGHECFDSHLQLHGRNIGRCTPVQSTVWVVRRRFHRPGSFGLLGSPPESPNQLFLEQTRHSPQQRRV
jgi:hypothetical protein